LAIIYKRRPAGRDAINEPKERCKALRNMESWGDIAFMTGFSIFAIVMLYVIGHMLYNRYKGSDELDGLFIFKRKKK